MRFTLTILSAVILTSAVQAQAFTIGYSTVGLAGTPAALPVTTTNAPAPLTATSVTRGGGLVAEPAGAPASFKSSNFPLSPTVSIGVGYLTLTLNPNGGTLDLNSVTFLVNRDTKGPRDVFLRSSLDSFTTNVATVSNLTPNSTGIPLTATGLTGAFDTITAPIEFRVYYVDASDVSGTAGVIDTGGQNAVSITGGFTPVPEPATVGLVAAGGLVLLGFVRRRLA